MKISKAKYEADRRYNKKTYEQIKIQSRKENRLRDLVNLAADRAGISAAQYITKAIQTQLDSDGITPDMLPENKPDQEQTENI